jgi:hypothetical protein
MSDDFFDFNNAGPQRGSDLIPENTLCELQINIRPGGIGPGGYETKASDGASDGIDCEFTVVEPAEHAKRKFYQRMTVRGTKPTHAEAGGYTRDFVRAVIEAVKNIKPSDVGEAAEKARRITGWQDIDGLRFAARLGIKPPSGSFAAKNIIREVITPDKQAWRTIKQVAKAAPQPGTVTQPATPPAGSITRPEWGK